MMNTATLPFIVQPKVETATIGNDKLGTLEIPKFYSLSKEEEEFIAANALNILSSTELAISIAAVIAVKLNQKIVDVGNALLQGDFDFFKDNLEEVFNFNKQSSENFRQRKLIMATAIIKHRLVSNWTIEDTRNPEKIRPALVDEIGSFAFNEQAGWVDEEPEPGTEPEPEPEPEPEEFNDVQFDIERQAEAAFRQEDSE